MSRSTIRVTSDLGGSPSPVRNGQHAVLGHAGAALRASVAELGGADPAPFAGATGHGDLIRIVAGLPSNHSPRYAPVEEPTIKIGVGALSAAAREWLAGTSQARSAG